LRTPWFSVTDLSDLSFEPGLSGESVETRQDADRSLGGGGIGDVEEVFVEVLPALQPPLGLVVEDEQGTPASMA
jgi:hypothetical protein